MPPTLLWLRNDLRVSDHPALHAAIAEGPVIPVYIFDDQTPRARSKGAAQRWWLHHSLIALDLSFRKRGSALTLRRGMALDQLRRLAEETGCRRIHATRVYEPWYKHIETRLATDYDLVLHDGNYLAAPDSVTNAQGQRYQVFTPWYRKLLERMPPAPLLPPPGHIPSPDEMPTSDSLDEWNLRPTRPNWAVGFGGWEPGEKGAWRRARQWLPHAARYKTDRDFPARPATSRLSPHLHFGEITPRALWHALADRDGAGEESFRSELDWREHGTNLVDQFPDYADRNGRSLFDDFDWRDGDDAEADFAAWTRGLTGYPIVDAGMRELWQTGWMHNRVRMVTASFLVKHLMIDWRRGERWFWDTLLDADLGSNTMNWQYVAGTGVDAPVFSRIKSPTLQCDKFAMTDYVRQFVPELADLTDTEIIDAHDHGARPSGYPEPLIGHREARVRALTAWEAIRGGDIPTTLAPRNPAPYSGARPARRPGHD